MQDFIVIHRMHLEKQVFENLTNYIPGKNQHTSGGYSVNLPTRMGILVDLSFLEIAFLKQVE